jgi:hypothetical protein
MFNVLVTTMTLIALGFVVAWWLRPEIRDWMEAPKYHFIRWGRESDFDVRQKLRE